MKYKLITLLICTLLVIIGCGNDNDATINEPRQLEQPSTCLIKVNVNYQLNGIVENSEFSCNRINGIQGNFTEFYDKNNEIVFEVLTDSITYINITQ